MASWFMLGYCFLLGFGFGVFDFALLNWLWVWFNCLVFCLLCFLCLIGRLIDLNLFGLLALGCAGLWLVWVVVWGFVVCWFECVEWLFWAFTCLAGLSLLYLWLFVGFVVYVLEWFLSLRRLLCFWCWGLWCSCIVFAWFWLISQLGWFNLLRYGVLLIGCLLLWLY